MFIAEPFKPAGLGSYAAVGCVGPDETSFSPSGWVERIEACIAHFEGSNMIKPYNMI